MSRAQTKYTKQQRQAAATTKQIAAAKKRSNERNGARPTRPQAPGTNERNGARASRPQAPGTNAKTVLCKYFEKDSRCPFSDKCTYAHGEAELAKRTPRKFNTPCWYFNQGGCSKSAEECAYNHVLDSDMRKPLHLQHPCPFYHHRTPLQCRRGNTCGGDHFYELTADEWMHHFSDVEFPGDDYFELYGQRSHGNRESFKVEAEDFPVLDIYQPAPKAVVGGAWGKPLSFKVDEKPVVAEPHPHSFKNVVKKVVENAEKPQSYPVFEPSSLSDKCWADYTSSEDEEEDSSPPRSAPPQTWGPGNGWGSDGDEPRDQSQIRNTDEQVLKEKVDQLQSKVSQILAKDPTKMPALDGDLKGLMTTALKQLLESQ